MKNIENIKDNWCHKSMTDDELKKIAKDFYNGLIFSDRHLSNHDSIVSHFMVLLFMGPREPEEPKYPSDNATLQNERDNKLYDLVQRAEDQIAYELALEEYPKELERYAD